MPARSQGCRVCVRRHLRCDLTRPTCLRCRNSGLDCDGYAAQWIDETERTTTRFTAQVERSRSHTSRTPSVPAVRRTASMTPTSPSSRRRIASTTRSGTPAARTTPRCYPVIEDILIPLTTYTDDVYCTFFLDRYFSFGFYSGIIQGNKAWIFDTLSAPSSNPVANVALRCLIRGFFGRVNRDQEIQVEASGLYSEGLIALRDLLGSELSATNAFDLLAATTLLLQYECLAHTTLGGVSKHARGLQIVIESLGPQYFLENRRARCLFAWAKYPVFVESLRSCQRSFLERAEWKAVLAGDTAAGETNIWSTKLDEVIVVLSGLLEDASSLKDAPENAATILEKAQGDFKQLSGSLQAWWESFCSDTSRVPVATKVLPPEVDVSPMTPTFLRFPNLVLAEAFCSYHAYQILIIAWSCKLRQLTPAGDDQTHTESESMPDANIQLSQEDAREARWEQMRPHALAICDALPNFALPQYRHIGGLVCSFSARVAWQALPRESEEADWVKDSLEKMSDTSGFQLIRNLCRKL